MGKTKPQPAKGDDAANLILAYLHKQNRPYSITDITNNLHNAVTKSSAQKILQQLVDAGGVSCKTQGKQSIYVIRQDDTEMPTPEELAEMDTTIESLKAEIAAAKEDIKDLSSAHSTLMTSLPTDEIQSRITELDNEIAALDDVLGPLRAGTLPMPTKEDGEQIENDLKEIRKVYNSRHSIFLNMAGILIDGLGRAGYEELAEKLGIEGDSKEFLVALLTNGCTEGR